MKKLIDIYFSKQFVFFIICGTIAAICHWSIRIVLRNFLSFQNSAILAYLCGIAIAFSLYRIYVFPLSEIPINNQSIRFLIINFSFAPFVIYAFRSITIFLYQSGFESYVEETAHFISLTLPPILTFLCYKFFAFK